MKPAAAEFQLATPSGNQETGRHESGMQRIGLRCGRDTARAAQDWEASARTSIHDWPTERAVRKPSVHNSPADNVFVGEPGTVRRKMETKDVVWTNPGANGRLNPQLGETQAAREPSLSGQVNELDCRFAETDAVASHGKQRPVG